MIILGIDPGTRKIGYGVIEKNQTGFKFIKAGLLRVESKNDLGAMKEIKHRIDLVITKFKPDILSIEKLFFMKNQKTAMQVAEMRGVIISRAIEKALSVEEYSPNEVKASLTGYGFADKRSVFKMVRLILQEPDLHITDDVSDALALAIIAGRKGVSSH